MPTYYFNADGQTDDDGTELSDLAEAKCEAVKLAGRVVCDDADTFWDDADWGMTVTDATGLTLFMLRIIGTNAAAIRAAVRT